MSTKKSKVNAWGNGLAVRLTKQMAKTAGVTKGSPVRITSTSGRIVVEARTETTLKQMLLAFNPEKHGGEVMACAPVGVKAFAKAGKLEGCK